MNHTTYHIIMSLTIEHTYFTNNDCPSLTLKPCGTTIATMSRMGFKLHRDGKTYKMYSPSRVPVKESLNYIQRVLKVDSLEFELSSSDPKFNLITDFPLDWNGTITYNSDNSSNQLKNGAMELIANFSDIGRKSSMARITIGIDDILKLYKENTPIDLMIKFESRATQWDYFVINRNAVQLDNAKITAKEEVQFEGPTKTILANGEEALKFTSGEQLMPLSEVPKYKLKLVNENSAASSVRKKSSAKIVLDGLPNPNPNKISIQHTTDKHIAISEMYVYV